MTETASTTSVPTVGAHVPDLPVAWRGSPMRARPGRSVLAGVAVAAFGVLVGVVAADAVWGAFAALALVVATLELWVPTRYLADDVSLWIHGPLRSRRILWSSVRSVAAESDGAYLALARGGVTVLFDAPARGAWLHARVRA